MTVSSISAPLKSRERMVQLFARAGGRGQLAVAQIDLEDFGPAFAVGLLDFDLDVEASGTKYRFVENIETVGGSNDDHFAVVGKAVHLHEQLVQGLLVLFVSTAFALATFLADGIELVDEEEGRLAGLLGQIASFLELFTHGVGTDTNVHLDELRTRNSDESTASLASHGAGQERLAAARCAVEDDAFRHRRSEDLVDQREAQFLYHQLAGVDGFITTSHVGERFQ